MRAVANPAEFDRHVIARMHKNGTPMPLPLIMLGLAGEAGELLEIIETMSEAEPAALPVLLEEALLEAGDVLWYACAALHATNSSLSEIAILDTGEKPMQSLTVEVGALCDMVKKDEWHGKPLDILKFHTGLYRVCFALEMLANEQYIPGSLSEIAGANIEKLNKRYPLETGGFREGGGNRDN